MNSQTLTISDWLPDQLSNSNLNRFVRQKRHDAAMTMVWAAGKQAGLQPMIGRVKVTIVLVFGQQRRRDQDNLYGRIKGCLDGLVRGGWLADDDTDHVELVVRAEVERGVKATRITLESLRSPAEGAVEYDRIFAEADRDTAGDGSGVRK